MSHLKFLEGLRDKLNVEGSKLVSLESRISGIYLYIYRIIGADKEKVSQYLGLGEN